MFAGVDIVTKIATILISSALVAEVLLRHKVPRLASFANVIRALVAAIISWAFHTFFGRACIIFQIKFSERIPSLARLAN